MKISIPGIEYIKGLKHHDKSVTDEDVVKDIDPNAEFVGEDGRMVLRTDNLVKKYRQRTVVNHVSINVKQGEIVGLLGPNGAGKTTTFYMTTGLITPNEGRIFLNDHGVRIVHCC